MARNPSSPFSHFTSMRFQIQGAERCQFSLGRVVDNNQAFYDYNYTSGPQQTTFKLCLVCELARTRRLSSYKTRLSSQ